jgi:hypothetical protein
MDLGDFLENLRELIVLLPVVILIFGPMLVRLLRRKKQGIPGGAVGEPPPRPARPARPARPGPGPAGKLSRKAAPPPPGRRPAALRVSREQVIHRAAEAGLWPQAAAGPEARAEEPPRESLPEMSTMKHSLEQRVQLKQLGAEAPEAAKASASRRRVAALSPLKRAIVWAEILAKPRGW